MRGLVEVRPAVPADLPPIARLALTARQESATGAQLCAADEDRLVRQLAALTAVPGGQIRVAFHEDEPVGFLLVRVLEPNLFSDEHAVYIEALYVSQEFRRRGAGHALLTAAGELAAAVGAADVYSVPLPGSRGVQRFLARLGFAPAAGHRAVPTSVLLRKLAAEGAGTRRQVRGIEDLIARRRKARIETNSGPVDLRAFHASLAAQAQAQAAGTEEAPEPPAGTPPVSLGREHQAG